MFVCLVNGRFYLVQIPPNNFAINKKIECLLPGSIEVYHPYKCLVAVSNNVEIVFNKPDKINTGRIVKVLGRDSFLLRKSIMGDFEDIIATIFDQVAIILSCLLPPLNLKLLDTLLLSLLNL